MSLNSKYTRALTDQNWSMSRSVSLRPKLRKSQVSSYILKPPQSYCWCLMEKKRKELKKEKKTLKTTTELLRMFEGRNEKKTLKKEKNSLKAQQRYIWRLSICASGVMICLNKVPFKINSINQRTVSVPFPGCRWCCWVRACTVTLIGHMYPCLRSQTLLP